MKNFKLKKCAECGKGFTPRNGSQVYCSGPHFAICEYCGKSFSYKCSPREKPRYCSQTCINEGKKSTVRQKYGVDNVSELQSVKVKISEKNSSADVVARRAQTCISRYGVDNPAKSIEVRNKLSDIMQTDDYLSKRRKTCIEKYGAASPMQCDSGLIKMGIFST